MKEKIKKCALCESRHTVPKDVVDSIYPHTVNLNDMHQLAEIADRYVCQCKCDGNDLHVYVTGITAPMVAVINACRKRDVKLVLWHWNPSKKDYYRQEVQ